MYKTISYLRNTLIVKIYLYLAGFSDKYLFPFLLLFIRYWMAQIFWDAGLSKISDWQSTIYLFKYEYKVPLIPPELAAFSATAVELTCPVLLLIGLLSRISATALIFMTAVIQFTYLDLIDHLYWAILLGVIILNGSGKYSLDYFLYKKTSPNLIFSRPRR